MTRSWTILLCASLWLSVAAGQEATPDAEALQKRVDELEARVAALERLARRLAIAAAPEAAEPARKPSPPVRPKPTLGPHDYLAPKHTELTAAEQVSGVPWLRKVPGLTYAKPRELGQRWSRRVGEVVGTLLAAGEKPVGGKLFEPLALGLEKGDEILSIQGIPLQSPNSGDLIRKALHGTRQAAILVRRKGSGVVLPLTLATPVFLWSTWPRHRPLSERYALIMASVAAGGPERDTVTLHDRHGGRSRTVGVGDAFDGYTVMAIQIRGEGKDREAEVSLRTPEGKTAIRLFRRNRR